MTGQRGKVQVGREVVDDASGCERGGMMVRDGGRKKLVSPHPTKLHSGEGCKLRSLGMLQSVFGASVKLLSSQPNIFLKTTISKSFTDQFPLQCGLFFFAFLSPNTHQHCPNFSPRISLQMDQPDSLCTHLTKRLSQHVNESQIISSPCSVDAWSLQFSGPTTRQHCPNSLPRRLF